jgi:putative oxidoreductase
MFLSRLIAAGTATGNAFDRLQPLVLLGARLAVALPFFRSGLAKAGDFPNTVFLFQEEYRVPLLPPEVAALAGTAAELVLPVLLVLGLGARLGALALAAVNALAVYAYAHVLLEPGFEAALGQHYLWGTLLLGVIAFGPGALSVDAWLRRRGVAPRPVGVAPGREPAAL